MSTEETLNTAGAGKHENAKMELPSDTSYIMMLSLIVLFFTILIWWCFSRRRATRNAVLMMGAVESGKTLLFVRLVYNEFRDTFTSMKENVETYTTSNGSIRIVDIPGHERLRSRFLDQYKSSARAIIYVVDSVTIQKDIRDVAEYLYTILSDRVIQANSPAVLILCNKQDQPLAKGSQLIKTLLEKEINLVRTTKSNQLQSVDPSQSGAVYLGKQGKDFEFSHIGSKVEFAESSALNDNDDAPTSIDVLEKWISKL